MQREQSLKQNLVCLHSASLFLRLSWLPQNFPRAQKTLLYFGEQTWQCFIKIPSQTENSSVRIPQKSTHISKLTRGTCGAAIKKSEKPWLRLIFRLINAKQSPREGNWIARLLKVRALTIAKFPEVGVQKEPHRGSTSVKKCFLSQEGMGMPL